MHGESSPVVDVFHLKIDIRGQSAEAIGNPPESWTSARYDQLHLLLELKSLGRKKLRHRDPLRVLNSASPLLYGVRQLPRSIQHLRQQISQDCGLKARGRNLLGRSHAGD